MTQMKCSTINRVSKSLKYGNPFYVTKRADLHTMDVVMFTKDIHIRFTTKHTKNFVVLDFTEKHENSSICTLHHNFDLYIFV